MKTLPKYRLNYYPFGSSLNTRSFSAGSGFRFGFNGKEKQGDIGGYDYDFGARFYDGRLGRWFSVDPHVFKFNAISSYNYCYNNPNRYIDKNGSDGELTGTGTKDDPYIIRANYAYVKGQLDNIQILALHTAIEKYNNPKGFKYKNKDEQLVYIKYQLGVIELPENTDYGNNTKATLRADNNYSFKDIHDNLQSNLNFININMDVNITKEGNNGDYLARTVGFRDIDLNISIINQSKIQAEQFISNQKNTISGNIQKIDDIMLEILTSVFVHEIYHNLGGGHNDEISQKSIDEMSNIEPKILMNDFIKTFSVDVIQPTKNGAMNLINKSDKLRGENRESSIYTKK